MPYGQFPVTPSYVNLTWFWSRQGRSYSTLESLPSVSAHAGSIPTRFTALSFAFWSAAKSLETGAVAAFRLNRFSSNATPSGKNSC